MTATAAELNSLHNVKRYVALITQTGAGAPVATVLEHTLGGILVWARTSAGIYTDTLASAFAANKTMILIGAEYAPQDGTRDFRATRTSDNAITITTVNVDTGGAAAGVLDDLLFGTSIEIRVYPV